ncbi:hypothetical protein KQUDLBSD_CDS0171 [Staphylococcus phage PG-2021_40]
MQLILGNTILVLVLILIAIICTKVYVRNTDHRIACFIFSVLFIVVILSVVYNIVFADNRPIVYDLPWLLMCIPLGYLINKNRKG